MEPIEIIGEDQLPEPPNGMYPARVDERGRLKLPVCMQTFINALPDDEKKLYATSLDRRIGLLYIKSAWRANKKMLNRERNTVGAAGRMRFSAEHLGSDTEMDGQGRVLLSPELRRELGIENQPVKVCAVSPYRIEVYSEAEFERMNRESAEHAEEDVVLMAPRGLL
ncbi:MAG: hypothetical protein IPM24_05820 [Bryobacterales bacterium]|nr:hypothetical protein [Bryobacterales bacterium]